jgi:AraC family transcriptional regulator
LRLTPHNFNILISDARDALLSVLPEVPIASSQATGWDKIQLAHYRQPPHILPEISSPHHTICINIGGSVLLEHVVDGHLQTIDSETGDIGLYPANFKQSVQWDRETEFLQLYLEPTLPYAVSYELFGCDRIEIPPQLTFSDPLIYHIGLALLTALKTDGVQSRLYAEYMANALAVHLVSRYSTRERAIPDFVPGGIPRNFQQVLDYINDHLEHNLSLAELANVVQLSSYHFAHLFKQTTGVSPHQYHIRCRIKRAKQLLLTKKLTIAEVAYAVGFASQGHLNYHFKRLVGMTPKAFLRQ